MHIQLRNCLSIHIRIIDRQSVNERRWNQSTLWDVSIPVNAYSGAHA